LLLSVYCSPYSSRTNGGIQLMWKPSYSSLPGKQSSKLRWWYISLEDIVQLMQ